MSLTHHTNRSGLIMTESSLISWLWRRFEPLAHYWHWPKHRDGSDCDAISAGFDSRQPDDKPAGRGTPATAPVAQTCHPQRSGCRENIALVWAGGGWLSASYDEAAGKLAPPRMRSRHRPQTDVNAYCAVWYCRLCWTESLWRIWQTRVSVRDEAPDWFVVWL